MMKNPLRSVFNQFKSVYGFTLIELLVVVTIIGLLTSIGVLSYQSTNQKARDGRRQTELEQIRTALEIYRSDVGTYPTILSDLETGYIQAVPVDPKATEGYGYYYNPNVLNYYSYSLCAKLELGDGTDLCGGANCGTYDCDYQVTNP